jgi:integrase
MAALTEIEIKNLKPSDDTYSVKDSNGLYLEVPTKGNKRWRVRYWFDGKENRLSLGVYPTVSLKQARGKCAEIRSLLANKQNPSVIRKKEKIEREEELIRLKEKKKIDKKAEHDQKTTFNHVMLEWYEKKYTASENVKKDTLYRIKRDISPFIGNIPISKLRATDVREVIDRVWDRGALVQARRHLQYINRILQYARTNEYIEYNPCPDLKGHLPSEEQKWADGFRCIVKPDEIAEVMQKIEKFEGTYVVQCALKLTPFLFLRPGELRKLEWSEFKKEQKQLHISGAKIKNLGDKNEFIVPLSDYVMSIFNDIHMYSGNGRYVFPGFRDKSRPMSEGAILSALNRLGVDSTAHGFRKTASTFLNEMKLHPEAIERQLMHIEKDKIRKIYNKAEYLPERTVIMSVWTDYLLARKNNLKFYLKETEAKYRALLPESISEGYF